MRHVLKGRITSVQETNEYVNDRVGTRKVRTSSVQVEPLDGVFSLPTYLLIKGEYPLGWPVTVTVVG